MERKTKIKIHVSTNHRRSLWISPKRSICLFASVSVGFYIAVHCYLLLKLSWESQTNKGPRHSDLYFRRASADGEFHTQCDEKEHEIIRYQLPFHECLNAIYPKSCSTSYATRCPDPYWVSDLFRKNADVLVPSDSNRNHPPIAISVGCNKGTDAVKALGLISGLSQYNIEDWNEVFRDRKKTKPGPCEYDKVPARKEEEETHSNVFYEDAIVYCIEAMPVTVEKLIETTQKLGWQDNFIVRNLAIADSDGITLFPNVKTEVGVEYLGLGDCYIDRTRHLCQEVPLMRLDNFTTLQLDDDFLIEILSIDAEGYDFEVLLGAAETLKRTKYLEFEYHEAGAWQHYLLSDAITMLQDMNFVCYWAGSFGHLWRITDCWIDFYQSHCWSNVACVNTGIVGTEPLAARMEEDFQQTLRLGHDIRYIVPYGNPFETVS